MSETTDEIKNKLDIIDIVREYIPQLKQVGVNWKGLCPFHQEKTPSFFVSPERQMFHCFGCGVGGDMFEFIQKIEGIEFPEALKILAQKAGVEIRRENPEAISQRTKLIDICQQAANFYHQVLLKASAAEAARNYLKERKLNDQTIADFKIGYAPDGWDGLIKALAQKGYNIEDIERAGLIIQRRGDGEQGGYNNISDISGNISRNSRDYYDRFRDRIIFPLSDVHGNIVGFTARALKETDQAKYINTPETMIYNKRKILYGLDRAKKEIRDKKLAVVVEGQMDALTSHQAGIGNVVAASGTALTLEQIQLLKRYTADIALAFDVDLAGQEATKRGIETAWQESLNVKIIKLLQGKDPDECVQHDVKLWEQSIQQAQPIMEYYFGSVFDNSDLSQVENRKQAAKILLPVISKLNNKVEQEFWLKKLAEKIEVRVETLFELLEKSVFQNKTEPAEEMPAKKIDRRLVLSENLLALILKFPGLMNSLIKDFSWESLASQPVIERLAEKINKCYNNLESLEKDLFSYLELNSDLSAEEKSYLDTLSLLTAKEELCNLEMTELEHEVKKTSSELQKLYIQDKLRKVETKITQFEQQEKEEELEKAVQEFNQLTQQLHGII